MKRIAVILAVSAILVGCRSAPVRPPVVAATPEPTPEPEAPTTAPAPDELTVKKAAEEVVVAAWAEPSSLPPGGGQAQILVRAQKRGGAPFAGVEVRLQSSMGSLFSQGKILVTDSRGMTRDRLTAHRTAQITLNAGGTRYRFDVAVLLPSTE